MTLQLILEVVGTIVAWSIGLGLLGIMLSVVIANTCAHSERKRNWHKGTHDYYGDEIPQAVKDLTDD